jgi:hypothetical protein
MGQARNLLELTPARLVSWDEEEDRVVLRVPRFRGWLGRVILPRLARPTIAVRLDALGSFVWRQCDGATPVSVIAQRLGAELGAEPDTLYQRLAQFVRKLERGDLISTRVPSEAE